MSYKIHFTRTAEQDLKQALDHIEFNLLNPSAADNLLNKVEAEIGSLSNFPERYAIVQDPVLRAWGIRFVKINNHLAFYIISAEENTVYVVRFLYGKRNWISVLREGINFE